MRFSRPDAASLCVTLAAAAVLFAFDPSTTWWFPSCPFRAMTGLLCPFCGSLRAIHALLHGAPQVAWELNPLVTVGVVAWLGALAHDTVRPAHATEIERLTALCFSARGLALVVAFGVLRNLPGTLGWMVR